MLSPRRRRAPLVLLHYPSVLTAVLGAALLASLAASSSPFVTTAAASEALDNRLAELTPFATGLEISGAAALYPRSVTGLLGGEQRREAAASGLADRLGGVGRPVFTTESSTVYVLGAGGDAPVRLMTRTGALRHVKVVARVPGGGVWISSIVAETAHLRPGEQLRFDTATFGAGGRLSLRIKGVYRALAQSPQTPFWEHFFGDIYPRTPDQSPPPSYVFLGQRDLYRVLLRLSPSQGFGSRGPPVSWMVELPVDPAGMTLADARRLDRRFDVARRVLGSSSLGQRLGCIGGFLPQRCAVSSSLSSAVILADRNAGAVTAAVGLLSDLGTAIALGVVAAAGAFLVRRRRVEAALLYARGEHVAAFGTETAVAALAPVLAGAAAGFGLAYTLTSVFAPTGSTDPATARSAAVHAAATAGVALLLFVATASLAFLRLYETGARRGGWPRRIPWELPVLGVALYLLVEIETGGGMSGASTGATHPTLAVFVLPLLLVAGSAGLAVRLALLLLRSRRLRGAGAGARSAPVYLAFRRLAAARGLLVLLAVVSAVAIGSFCYADALEASLGRSTVEKAYMATGSDAQALVADNGPLPASFPYPITRVEFSNQNASIDGPGGDLVDVMLVDPASIVSTLHWQSGWGPNPAGLIRDLASSPASPLPVIVTPGAARMRRLSLQGDNLPVRILGTVKAFPEMSVGVPLVITSYRALGEVASRAGLYAPLGVVQTYVWGRGPPLQVERALTASTLEVMYPSSIETYLADPNVVLATRTFSFMRTIAIAAGVLVLVGLALYLQARQRSQVIASALARRMGLGGVAESLSLTLELGAILLFAALLGGGVALAAARPIVGHIDPLPQDPPAPVFALPIPGLLVVAGGLVLAAAGAGFLTSRLAGRADVSEALRVD